MHTARTRKHGSSKNGMLVNIWKVATLFGILLTLVGCGKGSIIEYQRTGGLLNYNDRLTITENGSGILTRMGQSKTVSLTPDDMRSLTTLFETVGFSSLQNEYKASSSSADLITYVITYKGHTVRAEDTAIPLVLQPVFDKLNMLVDSLK